MAWKIDFTLAAKRKLRKLDAVTAARITNFLRQKITDDPRSKGEPLSGPWAAYWKYRVGDYRLICEIEDQRLVVLVVEIGHRSQIYR